MAAVLGHAALELVVVALGVLRIGGAGEHDLRRARSQLQSGVGRAGLDDHRLALRRARDVERAVDLEELAFVMDGMLGLGLEVEAAAAVAHEGVVVPRIPQLVHHVDELAGLLVALGVGRQHGMAEVARGVVVGRGDDVPGRASGGDVVERGELARHVVGFGEAGRDRRAEADMRRRAREAGKQRDRLQHVHEHREPAPGMEIVGPRRGRVGDEEQVEQAALGGLGERAIVGDVGRPLGIGLGMQPRRRMAAGRPADQHRERNLLAHSAPLLARAPCRRGPRRHRKPVRRGVERKCAVRVPGSRVETLVARVESPIWTDGRSPGVD